MDQETDELVQREKSLWVPETRFDRAYMERILHPEFAEFGQSGRVYTREQIFDAPREFAAEVRDLTVRRMDANAALVTYVSVLYMAGHQLTANRSSLWVREENGLWLLRFHQGTPVAGREP